ncbi:protein kinase domain-containing protein [Nannocystaceae bacterium ST9]
MAVPLPGYVDFHLLRSSARARVYEATRERDGTRVVAKVFEVDDPAVEARVEHEFRLVQRIDCEGVVRAIGIERVGNELALLFEHVESINLRHYAAGRSLAIDEFLRVAIALTETLATIHERRVIHRDIKPSNLLIRPDGRVLFADFGIAVLLESERRHLYDSDVMQGTLPYISPEATGRTKRSVDFRSDLYSLGASFYELLTGEQPFASVSPAGLINAHLTRRPQPPRSLRAEIPTVLSAIVLRLLEKAPELRYQSAHGLRADLQRLADERAAGVLEPEFPLGKLDQAGVLQMPVALYDRDEAIATLEHELDLAFREHQRRAMLVVGAAGLGKSALIHAFETSLLERGNAVAIGNFEVPPKQVPYQAIVQALTILVERTLTETDAVLERWRARLRAALGSSAAAAAELIPSLALVLGELPELPEIGPSEARNRLHRTIGRLLDVLGEQGPLAVILDDAHWADPASVDLLRALLRERKPSVASTPTSLILILTLRGDRVDTNPPLARLLRELELGPHPPTRVELEPLHQRELEQLLADMLGRRADEVRGLAELVGRRSENNPLFVRQLLLHLADLGLLHAGGSGWVWDERAIAESQLPDDMLGVMAAKLARLPQHEREILQVAACIGARFDAALLEAVFLDPNTATLSQHVAVGDGLRRLTNEGLLLAIDKGFQFSHEHIQASARATLSAEQRASVHASVGRYLLVRRRGMDVGDQVFLIVDQLRAGIGELDELRGSEQAIELASLAFDAGSRALGSAAWASARRYLEFASELIAPRTPALRSPDTLRVVEPSVRALAFDVQLAHAQVLGLVGEYEAAERAFDELLTWSFGLVDRARVVARRIRLLALRGRMSEALASGLSFLARCGLHVPEQPTRRQMATALLLAWWRFRAVDLAQLEALPPASDERALAAMQVVAAIKGPAYVVRPKLFVILTGLHARLLLDHGSHPSMALGLAQLAIAALALRPGPRGFARIDRLCNAALELSSRRTSSSPVLARTAVLLFVWPIIRPFRAVTREIEAIHQLSLDSGDLENSGYLAALGLALHLEDGTHLRDVLELHDRLVDADPRWGTLEMAKIAELTRRFAATLRTSGDQAIDASASAFDLRSVATLGFMTRDELAGLELSRASHYACVVVEMLGRWLLGERERVAELVASIDHDFEQVLFGTWQVPRCALLGALVAIDRAWRERPRGLARRRLFAYLGHRRAILRRWAAGGPANYAALAELLDAELASLRDQPAIAQDRFERANKLASEQGLHSVEALVCERFAQHALRLDHSTTAEGALRQAHTALHRWGARVAVRRLEREYPNAFPDPHRLDERETTTHPSSAEALLSLDAATLLRILETLGQDLKLDEVVARVLRSASENAGADFAALLLERDGVLGLVALSEELGERAIEPAIPLDEIGDRLPTSAIHFVLRTGKPLVIDDVGLDPRFAGDPHVLVHKPRSLLCIPIDKHGRRLGALVLTNRLSSHAFTAGRLELLGVLSDQAAHALENAQLYDDLQRAEAKWRTLVKGVPDIITLIDDRGIIEFVNHLGPIAPPDFEPERLVGMPSTMVLNAENLAEYRRCFAEVLAQGELRELDAEFKMPGRGTHWYQIRLAPITVGGRVAKVISIGTDVTARRNAERERSQLEAQLRQQQRLESIGTLASGVAHEINNPVQGIMNYADLIAARADDGEQVREFAAEIGTESQRVATIVRNLLAFSRQEHEQEPEFVEVRRVVETTLSLIRTVLRKDEIQLEVELADDLPRIRCRAQQIQQVLMNLITNARDAVNEAGSKRIRLLAHRLEHEGAPWVRISVRDEGPGIPEPIRQRIFDPFFTTKRHDKGTGLGLAVSHGIAVDHGGSLSVESELGVGSSFHLDLPAGARG